MSKKKDNEEDTIGKIKYPKWHIEREGFTDDQLNTDWCRCVLTEFKIIGEKISTFNPKFKGGNGLKPDETLKYSDFAVRMAMRQYIRPNQKEKRMSTYFGGSNRIATWFGRKSDSTISGCLKRLSAAKLITATTWYAKNEKTKQRKPFSSMAARDKFVSENRCDGWKEGTTEYEVLDPLHIKSPRRITLDSKWEELPQDDDVKAKSSSSKKQTRNHKKLRK